MSPSSPRDIIPFERPFITGDEIENIRDAIERRELKGNGPYTKRCQEWLQRMTGAPAALMTHSGTAALEMCALLLDIEPGDEVILPSFTFSSTANAFLLRGAKLVFAEIRPDTLNICPDSVESLITDRTKAICLVHYGSVACDMDRFTAISERRGIPLVEDAAHALLAKYRGKPLGTFSPVSAFSFHQTKNFSAGEGGAIVVNDPALIERAEILWEKGTNRRKFFRGEVDKYTWVDTGSSFLASELTVAFLWAQFEHSARIQQGRLDAWNTYYRLLENVAASSGFTLPYVPEECEHVAHLFYLLLETTDERDALMRHLNADGISAVFHYIPLHSAPMGLSLGNAGRDLPITDSVAGRLLRLPLYSEITFEDQVRIVDSICRYYGIDSSSLELSKAV